MNTNRGFYSTKVSKKDFQCFSKLSHSFPPALFTASGSLPSRHVSEELFIHIKALSVRLYTEQAQMRSYSRHGGLSSHKLEEVLFCVSNASAVYEVSETDQSAILGIICWKIVTDRSVCVWTIYIWKRFDLFQSIRLPKCVTYSCFISIVHVGGKSFW